ncbi:hypothetical protein N7489_007136 [Penicillium chrysogenum]|jgi:hypothetical protein|uniref:Uncharacterized protein n=1 Tax=Penicillium chrysogenum TaxID=5076 RepID=A0ABQ8W5M8_PENCH|nr:uncharacterized protein N7489_007136 [Penicillium chrysogenum]MBZ6429910.1 hypothetical protein [Acinetobacter pittii]KAJ5237045.1 hypothetical protein N7489_007136 [Penicillium chrysogenum]KAJ5255984.1 hypothetical protein N7505_011135 [Penicillium chrysogenum]KAJ5277008.1 hypothetical protein N7524_003161 [Penicillium chrysogenum]KAJ6152248.1 hypothetical protein N7497_006567 [Penicillium chrysogenum]
MGCRQLGLNLQDLRLTFHNAVEDFNYDQSAMSGSWDIFREYMSNPANSNFVLRVRLEPFDMEDPLGHFFEDPEIPIDVEQFVSTVLASAPVATESTVVPASSSILEQSVPFVDSRVTDSDFAKSKQFADEDEKRKFYDNYNVEDRDPASTNGRIA